MMITCTRRSKSRPVSACSLVQVPVFIIGRPVLDVRLRVRAKCMGLLGKSARTDPDAPYTVGYRKQFLESQRLNKRPRTSGKLSMRRC